MALTRAQYLSGNNTQGVVLNGQVQGVRQGPGIIISPDGVISVNGDDPTINSLVRTNNPTAYNNYIWPNNIPGAGITILSINGAGQLSWAAPGDPAFGIGTIWGVVAGGGLTGGGNSGVVTLDVGAGTGITVNADNVAITATGVVPGSYTTANITVNAQGQLTSASSGVNPQFISVGVGTPAGGVPGEIRATDDIIAFFASDRNLKENIRNIEQPLDKLRRLNGVTFEWSDAHIEKRGGVDGFFVKKEDVGVIAQEVQLVIPQAVGRRADGNLGVRYELIIPLLIEAIKTLESEVDVLKTQLDQAVQKLNEIAGE